MKKPQQQQKQIRAEVSVTICEMGAASLFTIIHVTCHVVVFGMWNFFENDNAGMSFWYFTFILSEWLNCESYYDITTVQVPAGVDLARF